MLSYSDNKSTIKLFLLIIIIVLFGNTAFAQVQDTLVTTLGDTLFTLVDTGLDSVANNGTFTSPINSDADSVSIVPGESITYFGTENKPAKISFEDMTIEAMKITLFLDGDSLVAEGISVPADRDTFPEGFRIIGSPVFTQEGQQPLTGSKMVYNLATKKAKILEGRTKFEGGFYYGDVITRVNSDILQIQDGYFTTCDIDKNPHFHFKSTHMKMKLLDKVVARPVILYIQNVPIFILPFGVFPVTGGRNSGILMPSYGQSQVEGRYLQGIGYYYAPNDYMDAKLEMDYYEKSGVLFRGNTQYAVRYKLKGGISGSLTRKSFGDNVERRWDLRVNHSQIIDPTTRLSVSGSFVSDGSFYKDRSFNREVRAQRFLISSATLTKRWEDSKNNLSVSLSRREDMTTGETNETLPKISFTRNTPTYFFKRDRSGSAGLTTDVPFYETLNFSYNSELRNLRSKRIVAGSDTLSQKMFESKTRSGVKHNFTIGMQAKLFTHINITPRIQYVEEWFNEAVIKRLDENKMVITGRETGFFARRTGSLTTQVQTKLYGTFNPNIGPIKSIRHEFTPSFSYSFTPDFSDPGFGYFASYLDTLGQEVEYDKFGNSLFGGTPRGETQSLGINLDNRIKIKTISGDTENTFDLMNINMSTSYDFAAPDNSRKFSDLTTSFRIIPFARLNLSTTHSFYLWDPVANRRTNTLLYDTNKSWRKKQFIQLINLRASTRFSIASSGGQVTDIEDAEEEEEDAFDDEFAAGTIIGEDPQDRFKDTNTLDMMDIPWELSGGLQFNLNRINPTDTRKFFTTSATMKIQVTENWKVEYVAQFDLIDKSITYHDFKIYRDLHCWEFRFNWTPPNSSRSGFWLEIRVKDPKLRDLRIKKTDYGGSALGYR